MKRDYSPRPEVRSVGSVVFEAPNLPVRIVRRFGRVAKLDSLLFHVLRIDRRSYSSAILQWIESRKGAKTRLADLHGFGLD